MIHKRPSWQSDTAIDMLNEDVTPRKWPSWLFVLLLVASVGM